MACEQHLTISRQSSKQTEPLQEGLICGLLATSDALSNVAGLHKVASSESACCILQSGSAPTGSRHAVLSMQCAPVGRHS